MTCASFDFNSFHEQNKDPTARTDCLVSWLWLPRIKYSLPPGALIRVLQVLTVLVLAVGVSFGPAFGSQIQKT